MLVWDEVWVFKLIDSQVRSFGFNNYSTYCCSVPVHAHCTLAQPSSSSALLPRCFVQAEIPGAEFAGMQAGRGSRFRPWSEEDEGGHGTWGTRWVYVGSFDGAGLFFGGGFRV